MKYLFLDVETTGIDPSLCAIIQLSAIIEIDGVIKETLNYKVKPHPGATISKEALAVSKTTMQDLDSYTPSYAIFQEFIQTLEQYVKPFDKKDKFFFLAYNAPFDIEFVRQFFIRNGSNYFSSYFWNPAIDIMTLSLEYLKHQRAQLPNFKLMSVAKMLGIRIDETKLHDAFYDISITRELYYKVNLESQTKPEPILKKDAPNFELKITASDEPEAKKPEPVKMPDKEFFDGLF